MNIPVLLGLTWTQAMPPMNWQHITNDIHMGQHKPNFPSNSWPNTVLLMTSTQGYLKMVITYCMKQTAKAEAFNKIH